jgi:hypothetical protein
VGYQEYPDAVVVLKPPRGDQGSRQDWSVDAAFIEYANRKYYVEFLDRETSQYDDGNILEDSIYVRPTSRLFDLLQLSALMLSSSTKSAHHFASSRMQTKWRTSTT